MVMLIMTCREVGLQLLQIAHWHANMSAAAMDNASLQQCLDHMKFYSPKPIKEACKYWACSACRSGKICQPMLVIETILRIRPKCPVAQADSTNSCNCCSVLQATVHGAGLPLVVTDTAERAPAKAILEVRCNLYEYNNGLGCLLAFSCALVAVMFLMLPLPACLYCTLSPTDEHCRGSASA